MGADALMVVKELTPLRTMSYVDGRVSSREKKKDGNAQSFDGAKEKEQPLSAEGRGGGVMRGDNNVVNNNLSSDSERTPDDETRDLAAWFFPRSSHRHGFAIRARIARRRENGVL